MTEEQDIAYMKLALEQARMADAIGEVPIGAVVVYHPYDPATRKALEQPRVIARAYNKRETSKNPAAHAEFLALEEAAHALNAWRLTGCTVYVTLEPCIMCAGLMHQARVDRCVFGAYDLKAGACGSLYTVHADERLNHNFSVQGGVLHDECVQLLQDFFTIRRKGKAISDNASGVHACAEAAECGSGEKAHALNRKHALNMESE